MNCDQDSIFNSCVVLQITSLCPYVAAMCRGVDFWTEQNLFSDNKAKDFSGPKVKQFSLFVKTIVLEL